MHSSSSLALVASALALFVAAGCRLEAHTQSAFDDSTQPPKTATRDWNGEPISIENAGVNPLSGTGGVEVRVDAAATRIAVAATFSAQADSDKKSEADLSIRDALQTLVIEESANGFTIKCGHGQAHGTSGVAASGCKILRVTIPAGSAAKPHDLTVGDGNGSIRVGLANAGDSAPYVKRLLIDNNGLGEVDVRVLPVAGADLVITGERAVRLALPAAFSSQKVTFTVDETDNAKVAARLVLNDFPGMKSGAPYPPAGATVDAAANLNVTSKGPFADDTITVVKF